MPRRASAPTVQECCLTARATLEVEARALAAVARRIDHAMEEAIRLLAESDRKVVVTGVGKSGHVGQKIAATLCSTGTPGVFLHGADAAHGDLGVYQDGDPTILISKSGSTSELLRLVPLLRQKDSPMIAILGNVNSPLASASDVVLDGSVHHEADPFGIVPTASTTVALALGDALAVGLMHAKGFTESDFLRFHPAGQLGRSLTLLVEDVLHPVDSVAWVGEGQTIRDVVIAMSERALGAALVIGDGQSLHGIITDGDIRRVLRQTETPLLLAARDVMTRDPVRIAPHETLHEAMRMMEDRPSQLSVLPVVSESGQCIGLIRIHDIYQPSLV